MTHRGTGSIAIWGLECDISLKAGMLRHGSQFGEIVGSRDTIAESLEIEGTFADDVVLRSYLSYFCKQIQLQGICRPAAELTTNNRFPAADLAPTPNVPASASVTCQA